MNFLAITIICLFGYVECFTSDILPSVSSVLTTNTIINATSSIQLITSPNTISASSTTAVQINPTSTAGNLTPVPSINGTASLTPSPTSSITTVPANSSAVHVHPVGDKCIGYTDWNPDVFLRSLNCITEACVQNYGVVFNHYIECNNRKRKEETQVIAQKLSEILISRALMITEDNKSKNDSSQEQKTIETISEEHIKAEYGTVNKKFYQSHFFVTIDFLGHGIRDQLYFPPTILEEDLMSFHCSIYNDIYNPTDNFQYWREITPLRKALGKLPPSLTNPAPKENTGYQINSNILFFTLSPLNKYNKDYITLKFYYRDPTGTTNHRCVKFAGTFWTDAGCYVHQQEDEYILCRCDTIIGRYAIISDLAIPPVTSAPLERNSISLALMAISGFGVLAALASILLPYLLGCQHLKGMLRVYVAADLTFIIYCCVICLSVMKSDDMNTAKLLAATLHFLHHATAVWFIVEGVHLYHEMTPLYSDSIGMIFCYSTLAFGISAALAGAATGYGFEFSGRTQFLWAYGKGGSIMYMFVPTIGTILMQVAFDILLVWELMSWIGSQYDYLYTRSIIFIRRSTGYTFVYAVTHVFGVMAMLNQDSDTYAWLFIGFYGIETICLFYHHCISNMECWSWKELQDFKKEMELEEEMKKVMDSDYDSDEVDENKEESDDDYDDDVSDEKKLSSDDKKGGDLVINMENGSVFYGKPSMGSATEPVKSHRSATASSQQLTRRKSGLSNNSRTELLREDSTSSGGEMSPAQSNRGDSRKSLRKSPTLSPRLNDDAFQAREEDEFEEDGGWGGEEKREEYERPVSQASIATTVSHKSLRDEDIEETENQENKNEEENVNENTQNDEENTQHESETEQNQTEDTPAEK